MRTAITGLVAIPIFVAGGLGVAAAFGIIDTPSPNSSRLPGSSAGALPSVGTSGLGDGTAIEGTRPHLSVIDGRATLTLPGALPAILSVVSGRPGGLKSLPTSTERGQSGSRTVDKAPADRSATDSQASEDQRLRDPLVPASSDGDRWPLPSANSTATDDLRSSPR